MPRALLKGEDDRDAAVGRDLMTGLHRHAGEDAERFEVAPREKWEHITTTLRFVRDEVVPVLGDVEAVSGYRTARLKRRPARAPRC